MEILVMKVPPSLGGKQAWVGGSFQTEDHSRV